MSNWVSVYESKEDVGDYQSGTGFELSILNSGLGNSGSHGV